MAHENNVPWLYGRELREQRRLPHNTKVDARAGGVCICQLDPRPGKYEVNYLRSSMSNMVARGLNDFLVLCHTDNDRRPVVEHLVGSMDDLPENVYVLTNNDGRNYLSRRFNGHKPYAWLTEALTSTYNDTASGRRRTPTR
ncbi:hypothetical protein SAMN05660649_04469 [Desulfotomaculum arcticum]|uniref:Uncharacterized protein n=2 Tax=Desulfotruncus TaxID=2867377 RepID=A0A1I2YJQ1_9FIRM|nr:hypothetical protein SAMN05660649_04469 [Desulfotomaculum arcticum] [Desulfotruncus arcticus DSM 17038]